MSQSSSTILLNNGKKMPLLGLGCWQSAANVVAEAVETSLDCGYRHIDTAYNYLNEDGVGDGIQSWLKKTGNSREDLFIVTKLPMIAMGPGGVEKFLNLSLKDLKLDYVDLYLVHSPIGLKGSHEKDIFPQNKDGITIMDFSTDLIALWKHMERMVDLGLAKSIGVSNFNTKQLTKILANSRIPPAVNQIEMHAYYQQKPMQKFCKENNIVLTAYAPLGSPGRTNYAASLTKAKVPNLLGNPIVSLIAENHQVTVAQILLRFWVQVGVVVIPKSVTASRIKINSEIFDFTLNPLEMDALRYLDKGQIGKSFDLTSYGVNQHPEFPEDEPDD